MRAVLRRIVLIPRTPELAEVLTGLPAFGFGWNVWHFDRFGPPGTTVRHFADALGAEPAGAWLMAITFLPVLSMAIGRPGLRMASTLLCGAAWSAVAYCSVRGGTWVSLSMMAAVAALPALFVSQCRIAAGWHEWRGRVMTPGTSLPG